jgi:3-oxoacyl-[acyl-carrier protein] reductase
MAEPATIVYVAAKAAVEQFARLLAVALGPRKISVNVVAPGATQTDAFPEAMVPFAIGLTPLGRMGLPEDIAQVVLCVIQAPWITGAIIPANGGAIV